MFIYIYMHCVIRSQQTKLVTASPQWAASDVTSAPYQCLHHVIMHRTMQCCLLALLDGSIQ